MPEPEGPTVTAIDYDVVFARGGERQWTLFPHLGDTEHVTDEVFVFTLGRTKHEVTVYRRELAVVSRRERVVHLPPPKFEPKVQADAGRETPVAFPHAPDASRTDRGTHQDRG